MSQPVDKGADEPPTVWEELKGAGMLKVALFALLVFVGYAVIVWIAPLGFNGFGEFGDSFGALTALFNALAFAALIATVVLQGRELRESRQELAKQAKAQQAWAEAASRQIELTKQLEAIRIRPFIKLEWHSKPGDQADLIVRNVGLGVAVLSSFELWANGQIFGTVVANGTQEAQSAWEKSMRAAVGLAPGLVRVQSYQFDDLNRALAPGEQQAIIHIAITTEIFAVKLNQLRKQFTPVIRFSGADGRVLSTQDQYQSTS